MERQWQQSSAVFRWRCRQSSLRAKRLGRISARQLTNRKENVIGERGRCLSTAESNRNPCFGGASMGRDVARCNLHPYTRPARGHDRHLPLNFLVFLPFSSIFCQAAGIWYMILDLKHVGWGKEVKTCRASGSGRIQQSVLFTVVSQVSGCGGCDFYVTYGF